MRAIRSGLSLLELLVVITIIVLVVGLVGVRWTPPPNGQRTVEDSIGRAAAISARITTGRDSTRAGAVSAAAYPDGRIIADSGTDVQ